MKKLAAVSVIMLMLLIALPGCGGPSFIKIGVIAELTGSMPAVGASCRAAAELAVKQINDRGGVEVGGKKHEIELFIEDSAADPKKAASAAKKLVEKNGVVAIVGPNSSNNALAAAEVADEAGVLLFDSGSHDPAKSGVIIQIRDGKFNWFSDICPTPTRARVEPFVEEAIEYAKTNGKEKALTAFPDRDGEFVRGELHIYAYDFDGNVIAHGGNATLVGQNLIEMKDPNGVMVIQELRKLAQGNGGWLEYMWENPLTGKVEPKVVYVLKVDDDWWLGSGFYE